MSLLRHDTAKFFLFAIIFFYISPCFSCRPIQQNANFVVLAKQRQTLTAVGCIEFLTLAGRKTPAFYTT